MSIAWLTPAAFAGFALLALPIAIHLFVRQQTRIVAFPSLRFLNETALAAFRRRAIQDAALLACRLAIVTFAVLAGAGPIVQTASRTASYGSRISRAIVTLDGTEAGDDSASAFRSAVFTRAHITDALTEAVRWLDAQPPSAREILLTGSFKRGQIDDSDLLVVPRDVGIRFGPSPQRETANRLVLPMLMRREGRPVRIGHSLQLDADATRVSPGNGIDIPRDSIRVLAAPADQPLADAALGAALDAGIPWTMTGGRVVVVWEGAELPPQGEAGLEIIRMAVPVPPATAATAVWSALSRSIKTDALEPMMITRAERDSWSRLPGPPSPSATPVDEGDRKWMWAAALIFLAAEHWLRRGRAPTITRVQEERHVA